MSNVELKEWLGEWTFKDRNKKDLTHSIHRYPAMFIPELADKIIRNYSEEGDTVLDIFSGSGTSLLESVSMKRIGLGIELNPLAYFISINKIKQLNIKDIDNSIKEFDDGYLLHKNKNIIDFEGVSFWFHEFTIESISIFLSFIERFNEDVKSFFKICLSEIIREISYCNHAGFKMHKDKNKCGFFFGRCEFYNKINSIIKRNRDLYYNYSKIIGISNYIEKSKVYHSDSRNFIEDIGYNSVDLILTSPPYGDSKTTVAYGQFSRLSMQILNMEPVGNSKITQVDNELLGGKITNISFENRKEKSLTLQNIKELFILRSQLALDKKQEKRTLNRLKDILSFYDDLEMSISNAYRYLKLNKYFVLITASRVVHDVKLHTDQIISEVSTFYGFKIESIFYRDIHNKRMPSKVSATNIIGETAPTMTEETIIILKKIK